ncbi:hypothetical protein BD410DRAFT_130677 [Rickenella mellea]|uniref:AP180 N-terminal homology (ANTH) domain-containing protein n=1 Tax=Rickenella mellea TaxID=50990 RepID=A0A4Y7Q8I9_9AGAM|nr:hypothetical protein BD410DRAFT_130677 [Rickenella mellea]
MSHADAKSALALYRLFCKQTERAMEYLGIAKSLQYLLNVSIPNLKHAPVSLVGSLVEYLIDPNFEQNRLEYKANKAAADGNTAELFQPSTNYILKLCILLDQTLFCTQDEYVNTVASSAPASSSSSPPQAPNSPRTPPETKGETNQALVAFFPQSKRISPICSTHNLAAVRQRTSNKELRIALSPRGSPRWR